MKFYKLLSFLIILGFIISCKSKDPSILKVYVRSNNFILTPGATVRLIGDISEGTPEYFEEKKTDETGVALFMLDDLFNSADKDQNGTAYFTLYAKDTLESFTSKKVSAKVHLTSVETIILGD